MRTPHLKEFGGSVLLMTVLWLYKHWCFASSAVVADSLVLRNRQLLKPAKLKKLVLTVPFAKLADRSKIRLCKP